MSESGPYDFVYVHTDIPEGMTIREWREQSAAQRAATREAERSARRQRRLAVVRRVVLVFHVPTLGDRVHRREAHG